MDYSAWVERASSFLRSLTHLPGEIELDDAIEAPGTNDDHMRSWLWSSKCSLPAELKAFVATGSQCCSFRYRWKPPEQLRGNLGAMFVNREQLTGGASLCGAYKFHNYDNREWFQHDFPTLMEDAALSIGTMLAPEVAELLPIRNMMGAIAKSTGVEDDERDYGRVELLALEGGDKISLGLDVIGGTRPVIYVNQNALDKRLVISTCFDEFLLAWEQLCYITPSLDNLSPWLSPEHGRLNPRDSWAPLLREILTRTAGPLKE